MQRMADVTLDAVGLFCPEPVFRVKIAVERMQAGQTIKVTADDPAADDDISRWASRSGHQILEKSDEDGTVTFIIKKVK